jgi:outer membrane protein OmpA-like peptidoglycan-associated protein
VRTEDLRTATRLNALFSSADPNVFPGQTFLQTSTGALTALKTSGETPFVFGINESDDALGGLASMLGGAAPGSTAGTPLDVSGLISSLGTARHYYRGTLKRVEPGIVKFSVLLNGARTEVPAVHARGLLKFADQQLETDFWWLDDPANPLTLKWSAGKGTYAVLTRIDLPESAPAAAAGGTVAARLADKSCRAELHGIYFESGSAELLAESEPTLKQVAAALNANPAWHVTVEGHTDNIGSAAYNNELSQRRANAVRSALVARYRVAANRIAAEGFGLSKPIESNATPEGRARNRRVELARKCP